MNDVAVVGETLPVPVAPPAGTPLSEADRLALSRAVAVLEKPGLAARLSAAAGAPLDMIGRALPAPVTETVASATEGAMRTALRVALATLPDKDEPAGTALERVETEAGGRLSRLLGSSDARHKALAAVTGAVGGVLGLATLAVELPVSTTLMLRSIAEIARQEGEDLSDPESALACVQVFALGGRAGTETALADSGYFAVRAALAKTMSEAARYAAHRSLLDAGAPPLVRLTAQIAARFGLVVSQKVAAQAVPVIGALGGAAVNAAFMDHFQSMGRAHFTVRRLERTYGKEAVRTAYLEEKAALGLG